MSVKKHKLDLLFKVRYQNPLPSPPFPPKLLNIPTNPSRYARPDFVASLANEMQLPMVVDAELGMPLDLSHWDCLWNDKLDDAELNPDPKAVPLIDPKDAFMLDETSFNTQTNGTSSYSSSGAPSTPQVSWLRKTEYISREGMSRNPIIHDLTRIEEQAVDVTREGQIRDIEASFKASGDDFDLTTIKHPNKPNVTAVESYQVLPDVEIWANEYDLFRFSERPGERPADVSDSRLDCAILRPMESDGDHFLAYYLPKEDETADTFKQRRKDGEEVEETVFSFVRDYETVKIEQEVPNEFMLVLDDGDDASGDVTRTRGKGAFYKNLERKIVLKKKRVSQWDAVQYTDKWDAINLTLVPFGPEEEAERSELLAEVTDPMYMYTRGDADAEGEVDETVHPPIDQNNVVQPDIKPSEDDMKVDVSVDE
ncbi:hypothetical protein SCHPADRAFT_997944 [Schizopora paradoxa]|uniref:RNA polymerase II-associated n=1 Tax=Schizopora paradoxa TaxID=27342 RepID=A0A0H2RLG3_9AGAM|nr:hypothetical protein SCHPADRAFT_997944 [Schizopora paradoxa]